jgi:hypothetical protein
VIDTSNYFLIGEMQRKLYRKYVIRSFVFLYDKVGMPMLPSRVGPCNTALGKFRLSPFAEHFNWESIESMGAMDWVGWGGGGGEF